MEPEPIVRRIVARHETFFDFHVFTSEENKLNVAENIMMISIPKQPPW